MISEKTTHVTEGLANLVSQFKDKPVLAGLLTSYLNQIQELEEVWFDILVSRYLTVANDAQLDGIGSIVGEDRQGRSDADYRQAIRDRIALNLSEATPEDILAGMIVFEASTYELMELPTAGLIIRLVDALNTSVNAQPSAYYNHLQNYKGAGIEALFQYALVDDDYVFQFASGDVSEYDGRQGFSSDPEEALVDGDMHLAGVGAWTAHNNATLTKDTTNPYTGTKCLRAAYNGSNYPGAKQTVLVAGEYYRFRGVARGDGTWKPTIDVGFSAWTGTNSTSWQVFDFVVQAAGTTVHYYSDATGAGFVEYDSLRVEKMTLQDGWMETSAISAWTISTAGSFSKELGDPYAGDLCLRIAYNGTSNPQLKQSIFTVGTCYILKAAYRGDGGSVIARMYLGGDIKTSSTSNSWQLLDELFQSYASINFYIWAVAAASGYAEFDSISIVESLVLDGLMAESPVDAWTLSNDPLLSKEYSSPAEGTFWLKVAYDGTSQPGVEQAILTAPNVYKVTGQWRGDGAFSPFFFANGIALNGTSSTSWQAFYGVWTAIDGDITYYGNCTGAGFVGFDDITVCLSELIDGGMETSGVGDWSVGNSATLTKETTTPYEGVQCLRIAYNSVNDPYAYQSILIIDTCYRIRGFARGDGTGVPIIGNTGLTYWTGTSSTSWQEFDIVVRASHADCFLGSTLAGAGFVEFDAVSIIESPLLDGDMEKVATTDWLANNSATLSKQAATPYAGTRYLRVAYNGVANPSAYQALFLSVGKIYRMRGAARGDGTGYPSIVNYSAGIWTGTTSTSWQTFDVIFEAIHGSVFFAAYISGAGYCEFDEISIEESLLIDGAAEDNGCDEWTVYNSAILVKTPTTPYLGDWSMRVAYAGTNYPGARQTGIIVSGVSYRIKGAARGDGSFYPIVYIGSAVWTGTTSTSWQEFDFVATSSDVDVLLYNNINGAGYVDFGAFTISVSVLFDGSMEKVGMTDWTVHNNATLSKQTATPYVGIRYLRAAYNGTNYPGAKQAALSIGTIYRFRGVARGDGIWKPTIDIGFGAWTGTNSASWQVFDFVAKALSNNAIFYSDCTGAGYVEWDEISIEESLLIDGDMEDNGCEEWTEDGSTILVKVPSGAAEGTRWIKVVRQGSDFACSQSNLDTDVSYRITGKARGDGTSAPVVSRSTPLTVLWTGTSSTDWQDFDIVTTTAGVDVILGGTGGSTDNFVGFDQVTITDGGDLSGLFLEGDTDLP